MYLKWDEKLAVGVSSIDNQHKELFDRTNQLFDAMKYGKAKEEILSTLKFLEDYVIKHFSEEEQFMKSKNYSGFSVQHAQHEAFKAELTGLRKSYETAGANLSLVISTQQKIYDWWMNHILKLDKELGKI